MPPLQTSTEPFYYTFNPAPPGYDRCWAQLVAPYVKNRDVWKCPSDPNANYGDTHDVNDQTTNDPDQIDFSRAIRTDLGFNYAYLSPFNADAKWIGTSLATINSPAGTIMLVDSIWNRINGQPQGGGNWYVQAPSVRQSGTVYWFGPWETNVDSWFRFGGAWPWHGSGTQVDVAFVDGHQKSLNLEKLWAGLATEPWGMNPAIADTNAYLWDRN
jgi:prepilin-type processing-associated H-X9-DG protein